MANSMLLLLVGAVAVLLAAKQSNAEAMCQHSDGNSYRNGEEWTQGRSFIMRCTVSNGGNWKTEVVACIEPMSESRIPIGQSRVIGNDEWKCQMNSGGAVTLVQVSSLLIHTPAIHLHRRKYLGNEPECQV